MPIRGLQALLKVVNCLVLQLILRTGALFSVAEEAKPPRKGDYKNQDYNKEENCEPEWHRECSN